jgi:hypothetical protein
MICPQRNGRGKISDFVVGLGPEGLVPVHREMRCPQCSGRGEIDPDRDHTQAQYYMSGMQWNRQDHRDRPGAWARGDGASLYRDTLPCLRRGPARWKYNCIKIKKEGFLSDKKKKVPENFRGVSYLSEIYKKVIEILKFISREALDDYQGLFN